MQETERSLETQVEKALLRRIMCEQRSALDGISRNEASAKVCAQIMQMPCYRRAKTVMAYAAVRGELGLAPVLHDALERGKVVALPRCAGPGIMHAYRISGWGDLESGTYGLLEPKAECPLVEPAQIDLVLVPGTAFDGAGHRLGQGGGYYDRYLLLTQAVRVGVCYDFALLERVPRGEHDLSIHAVVTPSRHMIIKEGMVW